MEWLTLTAGFSGGREIRGFNISGLAIKGEYLDGFKAACFCQATGELNGVSIAVVNIAEDLHGLQIGLINIAKNNRAPYKVLPLVNYHR